jgi:hypothetical protein
VSLMKIRDLLQGIFHNDKPLMLIVKDFSQDIGDKSRSILSLHLRKHVFCL